MKMTPAGRLAFRVEGEWWNAYWAPQADSMDGAIHLGSVKMNVAVHPPVKAAFMETMKAAFRVICKEQFGVEAIFGKPGLAPERERSGSA